MAKYIATTDGNWSTVGTWSTGTNTPSNHASTRITIDSAKYTDTFTAPNTSNACVGVIINISALATSGYSYVVTLQENTVDTAATKTIALADLAVGPYFVKFDTPYTFTSTTAGYYRFKVERSGSGGGNTTVVSNSSATLVAFQAVDNRNPASAPTTGDDVWIIGGNEAGTVTVTVDGTQNVGSGTDTVRSWAYMNQACLIGRGGLLTWDTSASATLTCKGHMYVIGKSTHKGELRIGTSASPYPSSYVGKLRFDCYGTNYRASLGSSNGGSVQFHGASKTYFKTKYSSGAGTVASPMVVADAVDWATGDEIVIGSTSQATPSIAVGNEPEDEHMVVTKVDASTYSLVSVNKLFNEGFEGNNFASWTQSAGTGAIALETTAVNSGAKAAKLTSGSSSNTYIYQDITVKNQQSCTVSFYTRGDGTYAGQYKIVRQNSTTADIVPLKSTGVTGTTYTKVTETFNVPSGCTIVRIYLYCPATNGGIAYFDDVSATYDGLMYTHTTSAVILNLTRNVVLESTTNTEYMWDGTSNYPISATNIEGDIDWDWVRFNTGGGAVVGEYTIYGDYFQCDYSVFYNWVNGNYGPISYTHNSTFVPKTETLTGLIVYRSAMAASFKCDTFNKTLVDCFAIRCAAVGFWFTNGGTLIGCKAISCNYATNSAYGAFYLAGSGFVLTDCEAQTAGKCAISFAGGVQATVTRWKSFTDGLAVSFYGGNFVTPQYADIDWIDCQFGYEILSGGDHLNNAPLTSQWRFTNYQDVDTVDFVVTPMGYRYRTGTALTDTTSRTGGYAMRFQPTSSTVPLTWSFKVATGNIQTYQATISVWVKINNAAYYAGTHQNPRLSVNYDNGTVATDTATDSTDWQKLSVSFTPTTTYGEVEVTIDGYTDAATTNAYFYVDDFENDYPSGYAVNLGKFDVWALANPIVPSNDTTGVLSYDWTQDPYVVHTESQANALTGIALDYDAKTLTVTESHTLTEVYEYCKASARTLGVIQAFSTKDGITYTLSGGWTFIMGDNVDITGTPFIDLNGTTLEFAENGSMTPVLRNGTLVLDTPGTITCNMYGMTIDYQAAGTYNHSGSTLTGTITLDTTTESIVTAQFVPGLSITNLDETNITVENSATVDITVNNIVAGSRIQIYDTDSSTEMYNEIVGGTSWTDSITYTADVNVRIRLMYVDGTNAYKWYTATATITDTGFNINAAQEVNTVYEDNNIDGSTVTECSVSGATIRVYVDDPDNTTTAQRIYNWYQYYLFTEEGIAEQDGAYITATDQTHYTFADTMKIVNQDTSNPLNITGANIIPQTGAATNIFDLTNGASIALNFNRVEGFSYSSGSGLDEAQAAMLSSINDKTSTTDEKVQTLKNPKMVLGGGVIV